MERHHRLHLFHGGRGEEMGISTLLAVTLFLTSCLLSAAFNPGTQLLLNCGSGVSATAPDDPRPFLPDSTSTSVSLSSSSSVEVAEENPPPGTSPLYRTARVFTAPSKYELTVPTAGVHVVRLHFFPFSSGGHDLFSAVFRVSALDTFRLLDNFSLPRESSVALPAIKEYLLWVDSGKLGITFTPLEAGPSPRPVAFVSAVEVFTAPSELVRSTPYFPGVSSHVGLETIHRINMGGPLVVPSNDTLWRRWVPDEAYLLKKEAAKEVSTTRPVKYRNDGEGSTREVAPDSVYSTAQAMNVGNIQDPRFNITWRLNVSAGDTHLVRMHFYDFVSNSSRDLYFNTYVDDQTFYKDLQPAFFAFNDFAVPFYWEVLINDPGRIPRGESSRPMVVSVGRSDKSNPTTVNAILNGLEIMKVLNSSLDELGSAGGKKKKKRLVLVLVSILVPSVVACLALLAVLVTSRCLSGRRRRGRPERTETGAPSWSPLPGTGGNSVTTASKLSHGTAAGASLRTPRVINLGLHISLEEIMLATNGFDERLIVGSGGFGKVYRGVLRDGTKVAVKRGVRGASMQGYPEFQTEVMVLSKIRHRHLVSLIGYCEEQSQMILVYEFMEKGTLKSLLYGEGTASAPCVPWKQRLEICIGAARGIHYLHTGSSQGIIHRDLKSSNILLGEDLVAKVSDFGLSRLGPSLGETHVSTGVKGSFGYFDPEYFKTQQLTDKSDVYSFGVVLLEVLCARPVIDPLLSREQLNLAEWAVMAQRRGRMEEIVDPRMRGTVNPNSLRMFEETAVKCLAEYGADRPAIGEVLWNLEYCLQLQETEVRREPHEDSGTCVVALMPVPPAVRRIPSSTTSVGAGEGGSEEAEGDQMEFTTSKVFSQLITHEGR